MRKYLITFVIFAALLSLASMPASSEGDITEGTLQILSRDGKVTATCPLRHTDVKAEVSGSIARVNVTQKFYNPSKEKIEAIYVFPLPQNAAVDNMEMKVGERTIRADIKKREEAKKIYEAAKQKGHVASLLEQERPNIFTQSVANIMPGESVDIFISYVEYLSYQDGIYEFVFPMVVGPRYIPGKPTGQGGTGWSPDTDRVPDASRITPPVTPKGTRAGHDISISVSIDAGVPIKNLRSVLHKIDTRQDGGSSKASVTLSSQTAIPNKDFILQYETAGVNVEDALLYHTREKEGGFFSLILQPPLKPKNSQITPKEMIFVIDTSGSQMGWPIEKAKETMKYCIENMNEGDTFNLMAFSNQVVKLFDSPQPNTASNREIALDFLANRLGSGGTEMLNAVLEALSPEEDRERLRIVCFMTDGYVGNDMVIIDSIKKHIGNTRLFSFGVGNSVNRYLLDKMAQMGRGEVEYVTLNRHGDEVAEAFQRKIGTPLLTDIEIDWANLPVKDVYPRQNPDLFSGKPLIIKGRYDGHAQGTITLKGKRAGEPYSRKITVSLPARENAHDVLASLWARTCIDDLTDQDLTGIQQGSPNEKIKEKITGLGLEFRLMTQFTSFVAVEEKVVTEGGVPKTIVVPVEMPDGVSYEGVFGEGREKKESGEAYNAPCYSIKTTIGGPSGSKPTPFRGSGGSQGKTMSNYMRDDVDYDEEPSVSPEEKIDDSLKGISEKVRSQGGNSNLRIGDIEVNNGRISLILTLTHISGSILETLKKSGFTVDTYSSPNKVMRGSIHVDRLEDLAKLAFVKKIEPYVQGDNSSSGEGKSSSSNPSQRNGQCIKKRGDVLGDYMTRLLSDQGNDREPSCEIIRETMSQNKSLLLALQPELLRQSSLIAWDLMENNILQE